MKVFLKYWRDLPKTEKQRLMQLHNIKAITYHQIIKLKGKC